MDDPLHEIAGDLTRTAKLLGARPTLRICAHCHGPVAGERAWFCSGRCRSRAYRRRQAHLPEHALPNGGWQGRLRLPDVAAANREPQP